MTQSNRQISLFLWTWAICLWVLTIGGREGKRFA
ncbi:hypothetical protein NIES4071_33090 [Calothrix sp. NIES-4071]|nr:hypothetical protein NIES4071_33090 [Calothrix sp. NIES-4071]